MPLITDHTIWSTDNIGVDYYDDDEETYFSKFWVGSSHCPDSSSKFLFARGNG